MVIMQSMIESNKSKDSCGRIRCAILLAPKSEDEDSNQPVVSDRKSGHIQISPSREGPWTTVRLNYAAPAACWRFGNDVVASEVSVKDGNRYVNIRPLVSIRNNTDFILELCLAPKASTDKITLQDETKNHKGLQIDGKSIQTDEVIETEEYDPSIGWVGRVFQSSQDISEGGSSHTVST